MSQAENVVDRSTRAMKLARAAHSGQTWAAGLPYEEHLSRVANTVAAWTANLDDPQVRENLVAAAWLHDSVEDTDTTLETIEQEVGPEVRALVWAVTDEDGANRAERHTKTYPKIRNVPYATALKLADRIVNVEANVQNRGGYYSMYRKEHEQFRKALYNPAHTYLEPMWRHLDRLMRLEPSKESVKLADKIMAATKSLLPPATFDRDYVEMRDTIAAVLEEQRQKDATAGEAKAA